MRLNSLLGARKPEAVSSSGDPEVSGITCDSTRVKPGFIFFAVRGQTRDGNQYVQDAIDRGAVAVISDRPANFGRDAIVYIRVRDVALNLAEIACAFYGHPSRKLKMIGITGTNGKTAIAFMVRNILAVAGLKPGLIGTVVYEIGDRVIPAVRTTPEAPVLQALMAKMVAAGCKSAVMEVSSHALVQKRSWGIDFDVTVFTNLTHDHLDYHGTVQNYFQAKSILFKKMSRKRKPAFAVINLDDTWGQELFRMKNIDAEKISYGITDPKAMVHAERVELGPHGSVVGISSPWGKVELNLKLLGRFNVSNALATFAACAALGVDTAIIARVLSDVVVVPGRLEEVPTGRDFQVFVDYAHTADALQNVLTTLREICAHRLLVVFGCGGNRDKKKRPLMGEVVVRLADYAIITSDNPRGEEPVEIIDQIKAGFGTSSRYETIEDRRKAISRILAVAEKGDIILIAGKGHENYQEFANTILPFDDRKVVRELLEIK